MTLHAHKGDRSKCESKICGKSIVFVRLEPRLGLHPIDPEPVENGNIGITRSKPGDRLTAAVLSKARRAEWTGPLYVSHFSTCPEAARFRP